MNADERLELADLFIGEADRHVLYEKVKQFIYAQRHNDRSRILSLVEPLMGRDPERDRRLTDMILNG